APGLWLAHTPYMGFSTNLSLSASSAAGRGADSKIIPITSSARMVRSMRGLQETRNGIPVVLMTRAGTTDKRISGRSCLPRPGCLLRTGSTFLMNCMGQSMSTLDRRRLLTALLGGLVQAAGTVVLARSVLSAASAQDQPDPRPQGPDTLLQRADQLAA